MSSSYIFEPSEKDDSTVKLLKEELHVSILAYKRLLKSHSSENTIVCSFNFLALQKQFDKVTSLKSAILKLVNHDHLWVEL